MGRVVVLVLIVGLGAFAPRAASYLVTNDPAPSDVAVVLAGDRADSRLSKGLEALKSGLVHELMIDANPSEVYFGKTPAQLAEAFILTLPAEVGTHIHVCPNPGDSTFAESRNVARCLEPLRPRAVLIVTSDYHTRRALEIFRHSMPRYRWTASAAHDPEEFGERYWQHREWLKTTLLEWQKLLYWNVVERWQATLGKA